MFAYKEMNGIHEFSFFGAVVSSKSLNLESFSVHTV